MTVQLNPPVALVVAPQVPIVAEPLIVVVTVTPGVNPAPETVGDAPLGPSVGLMERLVAVIVKVAAAWSLPPSAPVAVTV